MENEKISLPIHSALIPVFYKNFQCLAQNCQDNCCCANWQIQFNKKDYLRLRRLDASPALRERLEQGVRRIRGEKASDSIYGNYDLTSNGGRCPFLDPDGLCAIQKECGHDVLPLVCTSYPRHIVYSPAAKEYSLSPSCEGVLQMLWELPDGIDFIEDPLPKEERARIFFPRESFMLFFAPIRSLFIDILQHRSLSLTERMLYLGITVQRLQKEDWTDFDPDGWVEQALSPAELDAVKEMAAGIAGNRNMYILHNLKVLNKIVETGKDWPVEIFDVLGVEKSIVLASKENNEINVKVRATASFSIDAYEDALSQFQTAFSDYSYFFENLMVACALYLIFPNLDSRENLWKGYVSLCNLYSLYRFASVLGCKQSLSKERLFHMIVLVSRSTLHNHDLFRGFQEGLFEQNSSTMAHMAILLNG